MEIFYTGIGSRSTPDNIMKEILNISQELSRRGLILRSGKAMGADQAFQSAVELEGGKAEIYIPWNGFKNPSLSSQFDICVKNPSIQKKAEEIVSKIHPNWNACSQGAKLLHIRNVYQVLGSILDKPSKFLICYAKPSGTGVQGGTNTAYSLAKSLGIPTFNLYVDEACNILETIDEILKEK